jgi:hypothetical protein
VHGKPSLGTLYFFSPTLRTRTQSCMCKGRNRRRQKSKVKIIPRHNDAMMPHHVRTVPCRAVPFLPLSHLPYPMLESSSTKWVSSFL